MDLRDSTANIKDGTNGTGANATVNGVGKISDGQYFDWNDSDFDYVTLPTNTHDFSGVFTVSLWAKFGAFNTFKNLIAKDQDSSNFAFVLYAGTGQDLGFGCKDAGSQSALASPVALSVNTWHHIAATIDGSNVGKIYVDGNMIATATLAYRNNHGSFRLGRTPDNFWGGLEGTMDEARVSSTVRLHNWINASWLNQTSNSVFNSYGPAYHRHRGDNWAYKMKIIFTGYTGSETLTNFPALVVLSTNLTDFAYSKFASSAGGDLRFTDSNELFQLNYEIEKWDTNGSSYVWAQVPLLSGTNTFIWAYWGNNNDTTVPSYTTNGTTWSEYYASVWHFDETIGTHEDSTDNGYDATSVAVTTQGSQEGQIDGSDDLNGNAGVEVRFPGISELSGVTKFTISAWTRIDSAQDWDKIFNVYSSNENRIQNEVSGVGYFGGANDVDLVIGTGVGRDLGYTTGDVLTPLYGQWAHWAIVYNGGGAAETDRLKFYLNGTNCNLTYNGTIPTQTQVNTQPAIVCSSVDCGADEMRISSVNRSADWLWACWMSQASNTVFNNYGSVDNYSIMLINNDASGVFGTTATMNGELRDNGGNATTIYLYFGTNDGGTNAGDWMTNINFGVKDVGLLATNIMDLLDDQTYYYRYYGTNTGGKYRWGFPSKSFNTVLLEGLVFEVE